MKDDGNLCAYCHMPLSLHCPGYVVHSSSFKASRYAARCTTRHCLAPLCDCLNFVETDHASGQPGQRRAEAASQTRP
jgi:hypothetical protein